MKETLFEKIRRWKNTGKTGVPEIIADHQDRVRRMAYERDVTHLLEDIEREYPMLIGRRDEILKVLHSRPNHE